MILESFVVEVLRDQPEDIVDFGSRYFECLDRVRNHYQIFKYLTVSNREDNGFQRIFITPDRKVRP